MAAEQTMPCTKRMASRIPNVGPFPKLIAPSDPTASAVVIICALQGQQVRKIKQHGDCILPREIN